eukprot:5553751-Amphidinium_carterae.2
MPPRPASAYNHPGADKVFQSNSCVSLNPAMKEHTGTYHQWPLADRAATGMRRGRSRFKLIL